ncbi:SDR family NAD(P)-dependent oxidoreductase, partial [Actinomadura sp. 6K520]|uniref:SDR family NAD(P)-dependent oxidoreductase n=1 Tax=Actinomadura sp. 6K520 TaxID=2530364 RepID=UPI00104E5DF3
ETQPPQVDWRLSAKTETALRQQAHQLLDHLNRHPELTPLNIAHQLEQRTSTFHHRAAITGTTLNHFRTALHALIQGQPAPGLTVTPPDLDPNGKLAFLYTGQGSQWPQMAHDLYTTNPTFTHHLDHTITALDPHLPEPLHTILFAPPHTPQAQLLDTTLYTQPAIFAIQTALHHTLTHHNITPHYLAGHSIGEITAAHLAGVLNLPDTATLITTRAHLTHTLPTSHGHGDGHDDGHGAMYAADINHQHLTHLTKTHLHIDPTNHPTINIAAINSPTSTTISGDHHTLQKITELLHQHGHKTTRLNVTHPFHSPLLKPILNKLHHTTQQLTYHPPHTPIISTQTGQQATTQQLTNPTYWTNHLTHTTHWQHTIEHLQNNNTTTYLEIGPHPTLTPPTNQTLTQPNTHTITTLHKNQNNTHNLHHTINQLHTHHHTTTPPQTNPPTQNTTHTPLPPLPTYPFQHHTHWLHTPKNNGVPAQITNHSASHPLLGAEVDLADTQRQWFKGSVEFDGPLQLNDHRLMGTPVVPAAAMIDWALSGLREVAGPDVPSWSLDGVEFHTFMHFAEELPLATQTVVDSSDGSRRVRCFSRAEGAPRTGWTEHVTVRAAEADPHSPAEHAEDADAAIDFAGVRSRMTPEAADAVYERFRAAGVEHGPAFRGLRELWRDGDTAFGLVECETATNGAGSWILDPRILDSCLHVGAAFAADDDALWLPAAVDRVRVRGALPARALCRMRLREARDSGDRVLDLAVFSEAGAVLADLAGLRLRRVPAAALADLSGARPRPYAIEWRPFTGRPEVGGTTSASGPWLVFGLDPRRAQDWCDQLDALGETAIHLDGSSAGEAGLEDAVERAVRALRDAGTPVGGLIVQGGTADGRPLDDDRPDAVYRLARRGFTVLRHFLRGCADDLPPIILCSAGAAAPREQDGPPDPAQSVWTAAARAIVAEHPAIKCVQLDLDPAEPAPPVETVLRRAAALPGSGHLAVRSGRWFEARLARTPSSAARDRVLRVRDGATYLISGGLGGLGLAVAGRLADAGACSLVLAGRTLPDEVPAPVAELRARGVRVELRKADLGDADGVADLLASVRRDMPPLRGVVHAAGVTDDGLLTELDGPRYEAVMDPKVRGAWHLHRETREAGLDFFLLFSSMASLIGSAGQANYIAANAFMDALAAVRRHEGLPAVSVSWGPWAETGMVARRELGERLEASGIEALPTDVALRALADLPSDTGPHVGLAAVDWVRYAAAAPAASPYTLLADVVPAERAGAGPLDRERLEELMALSLKDPDAARDAVLGELLDRVAMVLGMADAERERAAAEFGRTHLNMLGLDSLSTVRLRQWLQADFASDVPADLLLGGGTALEIAETICRQLAVRNVMSAGEEPDESADIEVLTL